MEQNPPQLSLPDPLQQGTTLCGVTRAVGAEHLPACWTGVRGTGVHPGQGSRCCCAHTNVALDGERHIQWLPVFAIRRGFLNSHIIKSG